MDEFQARMAALRTRFVARARGEAELVERHAKAGDRIVLREICHGMAGTAGMFGFGALGETARAVEGAVDEDAAEAVLEQRVAELLAEIGRLPQGR